MLNVGFRPYTAYVISSRQERLKRMWPQYSGPQLDAFCLHSTGLGAFVPDSSVHNTTFSLCNASKSKVAILGVTGSHHNT